MNISLRYRIVNPEGRIAFCSLSEAEKKLLPSITSSSVVKNGVRAGMIEKSGYQIYGFTTSKDLIFSSQRFKAHLLIIADCAADIDASITAFKDNVNSSTRRLLHNLTSLNAHNMQEIYSLFPQELLSKKTSGQILIVENIIKQDIREAALAFLRIDKNNAAMKTEFSVFNKLFEINPKLQKKTHNVHKVLMNVFYLFFNDFTDKDVHVVIDAVGEQTAYFDYESIHVAFFHLIENAVKYVKPNTELKVNIRQEDNNCIITFKMTSLQIKKSEIDRVFEEGYSGNFPTSIGKSGGGIGLSRARNILSLNGASIYLKIDESSLHSAMGIPFQTNTFIVDLPRKKTSYSEQRTTNSTEAI